MRRQCASVRKGALSNALNLKVALFFLSFLPQFLPGDAGSAAALGLAALFAAICLTYFSLYVTLVDHLGSWLRRGPRSSLAV